MTRYLTKKQVADMLGKSQEGLMMLVARGEFPAATFKPGQRGQRWDSRIVEKWLDTLKDEAERAHRIAQRQRKMQEV